MCQTCRTDDHLRCEREGEVIHLTCDGAVDFDEVSFDVPARLHLDIEVEDSPTSDDTKHELELWWMDG